MKIHTRFIQITPYYLFCKQMSDNMENIRSTGTNVKVMPMQFGGIFGQKGILNEQEVMEVTDIDGGDRKNLLKPKKLTSN